MVKRIVRPNQLKISRRTRAYFNALAVAITSVNGNGGGSREAVTTATPARFPTFFFTSRNVFACHFFQCPVRRVCAPRDRGKKANGGTCRGHQNVIRKSMVMVCDQQNHQNVVASSAVVNGLVQMRPRCGRVARLRAALEINDRPGAVSIVTKIVRCGSSVHS